VHGKQRQGPAPRLRIALRCLEQRNLMFSPSTAVEVIHSIRVTKYISSDTLFKYWL
jgi:hypothetical protein